MHKMSAVVLGLGSLVLLAASGLPAPAQQAGPRSADQPETGQSAAPRRKPAPPDAHVYIGWPNDGETLRSGHVKVWFGARSIGIAPAGIDKPNTGHHHLLINAPLPDPDQPIPNDKSHLHFGAGQTETYLDLPPGTYKLQLVMGDADHVMHDPPIVSKAITIHVQ